MAYQTYHLCQYNMRLNDVIVVEKENQSVIRQNNLITYNAVNGL